MQILFVYVVKNLYLCNRFVYQLTRPNQQVFIAWISWKN